jgi:hypothetical protein
MYSVFGRFSGWNKLTQRYGSNTEPQGTKLELQTIKVGVVRWRWCVTVVLSPQGMYLRAATGPAALLGRLPPVIVPWLEFKKPRKGHLYPGWRAIEMSIGEPELVPITLPSALYQQMIGYLAPPAVLDYNAAADSGGTQTGEMMNSDGQGSALCGKCGTHLRPQASFCVKCGDKVANR